MDIVKQIFKKKERKRVPTSDREYTDLTNIQQMMQMTQRRQGLGFDDEDRMHGHMNNKNVFVKKLRKEQILKQEQAKEKALETEVTNKQSLKEESKGGKSKSIKNTVQLKRKQHSII